MDLIKTLEQFSLACALSGYEKEMAHLLKQELQLHCDDVRVDRVGCVIGHIAGTAGAPRVMVFAHMDSLGLVIRNITSNGFLLFERLGGIPEKVLPGLRVRILTDSGDYVDGLIGNKSHHATSPEERKKPRMYTAYT